MGLQVERPGRPDEGDRQQPDGRGPPPGRAPAGREQHPGQHQVQQAEPVVEHGLAQRLASRCRRGHRPGPGASPGRRRGHGAGDRGDVPGGRGRGAEHQPAQRHRGAQQQQGSERDPGRRRHAGGPGSGAGHRRDGHRTRHAALTPSPTPRPPTRSAPPRPAARAFREPRHDGRARGVLGDLYVAAECGEALDVARQLRAQHGTRSRPSSGSSTRTVSRPSRCLRCTCSSVRPGRSPRWVTAAAAT